MPREPCAAGQFYPADPEKLKELIKKCFLDKFGPGKMPNNSQDKSSQNKKNRKNKMIGAVVPHAGYIFSGPCAAHSYKAIAESEKADLYIILGTGHSCAYTCFSGEDFDTPLGTAKNSPEFCKILKSSGIRQDNSAHHGEHSIEVQIPFLQHIFDNKFNFVPIIIGSGGIEEIKETAEKINRSIKEYNLFKENAHDTGRKIIVICSSDFTHYGSSYGYVPFEDNIKEKLYQLDERAIIFIKKQDAEGFLDYCEETGATICGKHAIAVLIEALKNRKNRIDLLKYYMSADILGDYSSAVGYGSMIIERA